MRPNVARIIYGSVITITSGGFAWWLSVPFYESAPTISIAAFSTPALRDDLVVDAELRPTVQTVALTVRDAKDSASLDKVSIAIAGISSCTSGQYPATLQRFNGAAPTLRSSPSTPVEVYDIRSEEAVAELDCNWKGPGKADVMTRRVNVSASARYFQAQDFMDESSLLPVQSFTVSVLNAHDISFDGGHPDGKIALQQDLEEHDAYTQITWKEPNKERWQTFWLFFLAAIFAYGLTILLDDVPNWFSKGST